MIPRSASLATATLFGLALLTGEVLHAQRKQFNAPLDAAVTGQVLTHRVSADGSFLVYAADPAADGSVRLVRAELGGSGATHDLGVEVLGEFVFALVSPFEIDPRGEQVVYLSGQGGGLAVVSPDGRWVASTQGGALVLAALDGSLPPKVIAPQGTPLQVTPDGARLLYQVPGGHCAGALEPAARRLGSLGPVRGHLRSGTRLVRHARLGPRPLPR